MKAFMKIVMASVTSTPMSKTSTSVTSVWDWIREASRGQKIILWGRTEALLNAA